MVFMLLLLLCFRKKNKEKGQTPSIQLTEETK